MFHCRRRLIIAPLLFAFALAGFTAPCGFSQGVRKELSLPEYTAELDRIASEIDAAEGDARSSLKISTIVRTVPKRWEIRDGGRNYTVSGGWLASALREMLESDSPEAWKKARDRAASRIDALRRDARAASGAARDFSPDRRELSRILARREFKKVHGPNALDRLRQKIAEWLLRLLRGIFGSSVFPAISQILIWALVAAAVAVLAFWLYRTLTRSSKLESMGLEEKLPVSARPWRDWLARAHEAAEQGDWRDAVHLAYWGGISFLESGGLWPPDRARTPREYLRIVPPENAYREPLSALTREFESVWYGRVEAGRTSFAASLKYLERMGCHSN